MNRFAICCAVAVGLVACGSDDAEESDGSTDASADVSDAAADLDPAALVDATAAPEGFDPANVAAQPRAGIWTYRRGAVESNSCGSYAWGDGDTPFRIAYSEDGAFVIEQGEPWGDFACFVVGSAFSCPERGGGLVPVENANVTISYTVSVDGDFVDAETLAGIQNADVSCEGQACALAPSVLGVTFPCSWSIPFEAAFERP